MKPEAQRKAIAEACGWREAFPQKGEPHAETGRGGILLPYHWVNERTHERAMDLPDYLSDHNAMAEAEKAEGMSRSPDYYDALEEVCHRDNKMDNHICATAAQRAEAFLRTIGKWDGS